MYWHLQQNRSPQPIPPTNDMNPTNQGNNNTKTRGRGFYRGRGGRNRGRGKNIYQDIPPICWWCKAMLAEKKPNIEFRNAPFIKNAGRIGGGHSQPIQTPPLLVILSRRKTRKGIH